MIYVNLCVQYICPLNKFYILLQNKVFNIYATNFYCSVNTIVLQVSSSLWNISISSKSKIIDRNTISYLQIKFIFEFCEWSTRQVLKNTQFLETTKLSITFMTIISFSNWARNELENFDNIMHAWKKNSLPIIKIACKYFCETCCIVYRQKLILSVFWKLPT